MELKPTWPWVLVRVCPKQTRVGSIYTPGDIFVGDQRQNKPLWEGIVLATWKPHWSRFRRYSEPDQVKEHWRESDFEVGDRVLFPHFAGLPVDYMDDKNFRLVREWTWDTNGGVMCKIDYAGDKELKEKDNLGAYSIPSGDRPSHPIC
jgi:co-chaperonin GroES (HSP10)